MTGNPVKLYIQIPNLSLALAIAIMAIITQLLFREPLGDIVGTNLWNYNLGATVLQICAFYLFAQYLRNFDNLKSLVTIIHIIIACIVAMTLSPLLGYALSGIFHTSPLLSFTFNLAVLASIILSFIAGFRLTAYKGDSVGGINLLGKAFILGGVISSTSFIYRYYRILTSTFLSSGETPGLVSLIISALATLSAILVYIGMINIYKKAIKYNAEIGGDED